MKLKSLFISTIAVLAALVGCKEDEIPAYLSEVQVSKSYVSIPVAGGSDHVMVTATDSWEIKIVDEKNDWLLIEPSHGTAGEQDVCFAAESTLDGRTAEAILTCGGREQHINIIQGVATVSKATCAEIIAGPDSKSYLVTGTCTKISNTSYGNWYINDGTGEVYIYGTVNGSGKYDWASFNIEVGDEVTVQGPKTTYNGTVELVDALFISVNKSLIKVAETNPEDGVIPAEGGEFTVTLENKGQGLTAEVPEDAAEWLSLKSVAGNVVTYKVAENNAGPRNTTLIFKTTDGKKDYTAETALSQLGKSGTEDLPFTVSEAIAYCQKLGNNNVSASDFYVKGIVSQIAKNGEFGAQYGNGSFFISEDGEYHDDKNLDFEAYRVLWLNNQKWVEGNAQIEVGAEVIICGKLTLYNDTPETSSGKAWVYSINGVKEDTNGVGTLANPFNVTGAIAAAQSLPAVNVYVKGIVSKILYTFSASYGTGTFWMSDDGAFNGAENGKSTTDFGHDFEAYSVYWLDNQPWAEGDPQVEVGQTVTICGALTVYNGVSETSSKKAWVYSIGE